MLQAGTQQCLDTSLPPFFVCVFLIYWWTRRGCLGPHAGSTHTLQYWALHVWPVCVFVNWWGCVVAWLFLCLRCLACVLYFGGLPSPDSRWSQKES